MIEVSCFIKLLEVVGLALPIIFKHAKISCFIKKVTNIGTSIASKTEVPFWYKPDLLVHKEMHGSFTGKLYVQFLTLPKANIKDNKYDKEAFKSLKSGTLTLGQNG